MANHFFPGLHLIPTDYALVGMGALVSGTTLGPITATLIIFELSNSHAVIVPAMVSCIASFIVVKSLYGYSTYEMKLLRRGIKIFQGRAVHLLESMQVKDYMSKKMELIHDDTPLPEILRRAEASPYPFFVVLDEKEELSGVLTLYDLRPVLAHQEESATYAEGPGPENFRGGHVFIRKTISRLRSISWKRRTFPLFPWSCPPGIRWCWAS